MSSTAACSSAVTPQAGQVATARDSPHRTITTLDTMAPFSPDEASRHPMDWLMFQLGPVHIVRPMAFTRTTQWFARRGYWTVVLDAGGWERTDTFGAELTAGLELAQAWNGQSLDALDDCLHGLAFGAGVMQRSELGVCVAVKGFETFEPVLGERVTSEVLEIFAVTSRTAALFGNRLIWLLERNSERGDAPLGGQRAWFHHDEPPGLSVLG